MIESILDILLASALFALAVPALSLALAHFGLFEPIELELFGKIRRFGPPLRVDQTRAAATPHIWSERTVTMCFSTPASVLVVVAMQMAEVRNLKMPILESTKLELGSDSVRAFVQAS